jgi:hypothetical protein
LQIILIQLLSGRQKTSDPLRHAFLRMNLPGQSAEIQMGMTVYQGGKQSSLIMVPGRSLRPLSANERKGAYVQNPSIGHYHCAIFDGRLGYGND